MFKKLKDKLAEEVKSSPQRIHQFAQAAQAAVTSASSSISDITNSDLFSIGDNDAAQSRQPRPQSSPTAQQNMFQDVSLAHSQANTMDFTNEIVDGQRQRRLSNSSFASDVSFRLPSYETPSMYHLQSDMEVSASEADDRGFSGGPATLERVTKEQLYAAYKRTQERYKKYRTQYGDLARHYKLLERENAKARSVLVETQDKALRRISELKEQCSLEQSAKAHLEKALRIEIEEKNMKIKSLNTKVQFLQGNENDNSNEPVNQNEVQLINLDNDNAFKPPIDESGLEVTSMNIKIEKMEQLLNKYKESLKTSKEKNSQITTELQIISKELENKNKHIKDLMTTEEQLNETKTKIQELNNLNEELQNQINTFDFTKTKELSTLELDLQKAHEEIAELHSKIEVFTKREEEYAISLAENKLSIHKELESKEAEIKSLKDSLSESKKEIQSLKIVIDDFKNNISAVEEEKLKLNNDSIELSALKNKMSDMETKLQELSKKCLSLEQLKTKADEEYKCLQLQLKQETAEKLAMIDRNLYLESKNTQLTEENTKKSTKISILENEMQLLASNKDLENNLALKETEKNELFAELSLWKEKCDKLELEIQEERDELVKLQTEIEKLIDNHESIQAQNTEFRLTIATLTSECSKQKENVIKYKSSMNPNILKIVNEIKELRKFMDITSSETKASLDINKKTLLSLSNDIDIYLNKAVNNLLTDMESMASKYEKIKLDHDNLQSEIVLNRSDKTELLHELDSLRKENNNLEIKLKEYQTELVVINDKLKETSNKYEVTLEQKQSTESENKSLKKSLEEKEDTAQELQVTLDSERLEHLTTIEKFKMYDMEKQNLHESIRAFELNSTTFNVEIEKLKDQHKNTLDEIMLNHEKVLKIKDEEIEKTYLQGQDDLNLQITQHSHTLEQLKLLRVENNELKDSIKYLENKNETLGIEIGELRKQHKEAMKKVNELNVEILNKTEVLAKSQENQISLENEVVQYKTLCNTITELENDKKIMIEKLKSIENINMLLKTELEELRSRNIADDINIKELNTALASKLNECDAKQVRVNELEGDIQSLTQENIALKTETADFAFNIKTLELEIDDIRQSHDEIEKEKDRLNEFIEKLESKEIKDSMKSIDTQTDKDSDDKNATSAQGETSAVFENKWLLENKQTDMSHTGSLNLKNENLDEMYEQYSSLKINYDSLKEENRRLKSDIEGLQTYLTKISKENSVLNDKLRELIATSEHSTDNDQSSNDVKVLRNEVQIGKERINDLLRENSLLIEENLELKDQLQSQNYPKTVETKSVSSNDKDLDIIQSKYNDLVQMNSHLEKNNVELEQINKSVSGNMQQLQDKNERLKLSNEKLERRLDEALVSLRHLHSLQENTELEYLRNILYEYLTGSGTHSITLAKVLSAIVKFDDVQTQMVLQKEKERQGFLRQLGII